MKQAQFLRVVSEAEARARIVAATAHLGPRVERVALASAWGRVLGADITAPIDVPAFDRSDVDGFAVRAEDVAGADELSPIALALAGAPRAAGVVGARAAAVEVGPGAALGIATGAALPRGADAVVMIEHTDLDADGERVLVRRAVTPGEHVTFAGTDIGRGEVVLRAGQPLASRETGILAALGLAEVPVVRRPRVLVLSTGDEVRPPGGPLEVGEVYDANQQAICDAAREAGAEPIAGGVIPDDEHFLRGRLGRALEPGGGDRRGGGQARGGAPIDSPSGEPSTGRPDLVVLSGGTSKGAGDLNYRVVERLAAERPGSPGIVVHGVAVKPGKPFCLAVVDGLPIAILPGFPLSALFTFQELVAPLIRRLAGRTPPADGADLGGVAHGGRRADEGAAASRAEHGGGERGGRSGSRAEHGGDASGEGRADHGGDARGCDGAAPRGAGDADTERSGERDRLRGERDAASGAEAEVDAVLPLRLDGAPGRTSYTLVSLVEGPRGLAAYPLGHGAGSVSALARADGYVRLAHDLDHLPAGARVRVRPLGGAGPAPRDLAVIGSHCTGLDALLALLAHRGLRVLSVPVGSEAGLVALARGEGDAAGVHLCCPRTGIYNLPFLPPGVEPIGGYGRRQGLVYRTDDARLAGRDVAAALAAIGRDRTLRMVNRNRGSGTRVLIDQMLERARLAAATQTGGPEPAGEPGLAARTAPHGATTPAPARDDRALDHGSRLCPPGYRVEARSHHAVAAAVAQGRADWGITLEGLAVAQGLGFLFLQAERYDLVAPLARRGRPGVRALADLLASADGKALLAGLGFEP